MLAFEKEANDLALFPKDPGNLEMMQAGVTHDPAGKKLRQWPCSAKLGEALCFGVVRENQVIEDDQRTESSLSYSDKDKKETKAQIRELRFRAEL